MIAKGLAAVALLFAIQGSDAPEGAISFSYAQENGFWSGSMRFRIEPDGRMTVDTSRPDPQDEKAPPIREHVQRDIGFASYRRIAALAAPLRRWKGEVPCARPEPNADAKKLGLGSGSETIATIGWADGVAVKVPLTCGFGPAQNDIELARAMFDTIRQWAAEGGGEPPFDGAANAAEVTVPEGEN